MTFRRFMGFVAMAFLWTGSQIPVYLFGSPQGFLKCFGVILTLGIQAPVPRTYTEILAAQIGGSGL
jgi:hypothetical protein